VADTAAVVVLEDTFKVDQSIIRRREIMGGRDSVVVERLGCRIVGSFRLFFVYWAIKDFDADFFLFRLHESFSFSFSIRCFRWGLIH
jgi:hypothetical protein